MTSPFPDKDVSKPKTLTQAFVADRLHGEWTPAAAEWDKPMASVNNVAFAPGVTPWTDCISHGELIRDGYDERLEVDPTHIRFLFQGCTAREREGKSYGAYPWRLGILEPAK